MIQESTNVVNGTGGDDVLLMTGGVVATDVSFSQTGNDMVITHTPTSETITIYLQHGSDSDRHIETLSFDDGSIIDLLGI